MRTYICATRCGIIKLSERSVSSLVNHLIELFDKNALLDDVDYTFRHPPSNEDYNNRMLELVRALHKFIKQDLPEEYQDIEQIVFAKYIHCSNAIEGNSLSRSEVYDYLYKDKSLYGKSNNELLQTRNHFKAKGYLDDYDGDINEKLIKKIHEIIMAGVDGYDDKEKPGRYRENMVKVKAGNVTISKPEDIQRNILKMIQEYHVMLNEHIHPINCMSVFHSRFEHIHPFRDGNGRTGRAILDYMLRIGSFPPVYFPLTERENYLNALRESGFAENYTPLVDLLITRVMITLLFIEARTSMYHVILSAEYRSIFISNIAPEPVYNELVKVLKDLHINEDDP